MIEKKKRSKPLLILGILLCAGPLWGLIVTVVQILFALQAISQSGDADPDTLAKSVSYALNALIIGFVAVPFGIGVLMYRSMSAKAEQPTIPGPPASAQAEPLLERPAASDKDELASLHRTPPAVDNANWQAIVAMADNRVIGNGGKIPWHLPEDFKWFKEKTSGAAIVMGRKTYESIGRPLPNRENIVVSRTVKDIPGCTVIRSLVDVHKLDLKQKNVFIIGGGEIYKEALPLCSELWISHVKGTFEGDAFFPEYESEFDSVLTVRDFPEFKVVRYIRVVDGCL